MIVVCAWCGKSHGEKPPFEDRTVSHTICADCLSLQKKELKEYLRAMMFHREMHPSAVGGPVNPVEDSTLREAPGA